MYKGFTKGSGGGGITFITGFFLILSYFIIKYCFRFLFIFAMVKGIEKQKDKALESFKKKGEELKKNV